ncbi:MAG: ABCB family ABC transporter ATP-binding protein/permease [Pseudomonadota bacterium]
MALHGPSRLPPGPDPAGRRDLETVKRLLPYLWLKGPLAIRARVVVAVLLLVGAKAATVYIPLLYKYAVDALSAPAGVVVPLAILIAYGTTRVLANGFTELRQIVFARVAQNAMHTVALETFRHLHRLSLRFHLERQTGGLSRAIERGTAGIENLLHFLLFQVVPTILEMLLVCAILWGLYDFRFALVTFLTIFGYVVYTLSITQWRLKFRRQMLAAETEANSKAIDSMLNYETVKYFGNEAHEARRFDRALADYEQAAVKSAASLSLLNFGQGAIIAVGLTLVMILAGWGVADGRMTVGDFVLVNAYLIQLYLPLNFLGMVYREVRQALVDMQAMFRLLEIHAEIADSGGARPLAVAGGRIEFDRVSFGYDPRRPILREVSFAVPAGRTVAIVGPSGAGKSTISRLLFRFYDVDEGTIRIDGQDLRDVTQASLRAAIGIVPQDTVLFNDTILYNIRYGRTDATDAEVMEAARAAHIHDFIETLPAKYESMVGERGLKLSGGEKQRVAIARALLKNPRILIFDEATSALDSRAEKAIQAELQRIAEGRTTLVIAHRLSTVMDADAILVLNHGRIVERGTHAQLLEIQGEYARMWELQREAEEAQAVLEGAENQEEAL